MLRSPNPVSTLFPSASSRHARSLRSTVSASMFYLDPAEGDGVVDRTKFIPLKFDAPICNVRILEVEDAWLSVLLVGWGKAWVKRSDAAILKKAMHAKKPAVKAPPVQGLKIDCVSERQKDNILELIRLVGANVTMITLNTLETPGGSSRDSWTRHVFEACPQIEEFAAKNLPLASLETVAQFFEEGACRVKKLAIEVAPASGIAYADCFFDYLANRQHVIAQQLDELELTVTSKPSDPLICVLEAAMDMVEFNHVLSSLKLILYVADGHLRANELELVNGLHRHTGELVASRLAPLELTKKLAFLSVIRDQTTRQLSHDTTALIFQFAAQCRSRRVHIEALPVPEKPANVGVTGTVDSWAVLDTMGCPCCGGPIHPT